MPYLIDSDWVIDHLAGAPEAIDLLDELAAEGIAISIITYMEVYQGVLRSSDPDRADRLLTEFLITIPLLPLSPSVARRCAGLRESMRGLGRRVQRRALDLIIAATAIEHDLVLVTRNGGDYHDVPGLVYQAGAR